MPPFNKSLVAATVETNKSLGYFKRIYGIKRLTHIVHDFFKIADLQACISAIFLQLKHNK